MGTSRVGVWWRPSPDRYTAASLWEFSPGSKTVVRKDYQPTGTIPALSRQFTYSYRKSGSTVTLTYVSLTSVNEGRSTLKVLNYNSSADSLTVSRDGYREVWYGCDSSLLPALAMARC